MGVALAGAALVAVVALPLGELVAGAVSTGSATLAGALGASATLVAVRNTLLVAVAATLAAVGLATAAALATERGDVPGRRALRIALVLPFIVPPFVAAISWVQAYAPSGLTDDLLGLSLPGTYGPVGVIVLLTVQQVPLAYVVLAAGLASSVEPDLERAARASGASWGAALRGITLPLLRPALAAAATLVFVASINAFGVPAVLGTPAGFPTVTTRIYADLALSASPEAFARVLGLAAGLVVVALVVVGLGDRGGLLRGGARRTGVPTGGTVAGRGGWRMAAALWAYVAVTTGIPLLALLGSALTRAVGLAPTPGNWTLAHFADALDGTSLPALRNSLVLALSAAVVATLLGGLLVAVRGARGGRHLGTGAVLTFALPGSALAVAVLLAYGARLRDSLLLILVAYVGKFWALGHRPLAGAVDALPQDVRHAARVSGAGPLTTLRTIVAPLLRPALAGAFLLVFVFGLHELTMSSLLYGPGSATLAVAVLNLQQLGDAPDTAALAVLLTAAVLLAAAPLALWRRRTP